MIQIYRKSRRFYVHEDANAGKIATLEALSKEYRSYLALCVEVLLTQHRMGIPLKEMAAFFPKGTLSSNIAIASHHHAIGIVSGWTTSLYATKIKAYIGLLFRAGLIDDGMRAQLYTIGKHSVSKPSIKVTQGGLDLYWQLLLDPSIGGRSPTVSARIGIRMSQLTGQLQSSKNSFDLWLSFSSLTKNVRTQIPLKG